MNTPEAANIKPTTSAADRRRASDARKRKEGAVRVSAWLPSRVLADMEQLVQDWDFANRTECIAVAIRYFAKQSREGLQRFEA